MKTKETINTMIVLMISLMIASLSFAQDASEAEPEESSPVPVTASISAASDGGDAVAEVTTDPADDDGEADEELFIGISVDEELGIEDEEGVTSDLINISVEDETLENVVQMFTKMSGINIIATSSNLMGTVTVNLTDVEWKPALTSILAMHNLALLEKTPGSGVYMIAKQPEGTPEPLVVETIFLRYTTVGEVAPIAKAMVAANGSVSEFAERNALVIRSTESNLSEIKNLIQKIDITSKQVSVEAKFMELSDEASKKLGLKWDSLDSYRMQLKAGPFSSLKQTDHYNDWDNSARDRSTLYTDDRNYIFEDQYGTPVSLSAPLISLDRSLIRGGSTKTDSAARNTPGTINVLGTDSEGSLGLESTYTASDSFANSGGSSSDIVPNRIGVDMRANERDVINDVRDRFVKSVVESSSTVLDVDTLQVVLSALKKTDGVSIVSNPKMIVANGATNAFFRVGKREPIIRTTITQGTADSPGNSIDARLDTGIDTDYISGGYIRTGIALKVVPVVKSDNLIQAEITPTLTSTLRQKEVAGNSWPELQVKEINTRFTLLSGQTVAIGGLTSSEDVKRVSKVPLLGDIPLIGKYLFSHTEELQRQVETIIFVTLALASPDSLYREAGLPGDTTLAQKRLLQDQAKKEKYMADLERMKEAADAEREMMAERVKNRLRKRK